MHLEVYLEEPSAEAALQELLPKILGDEHSFTLHPFRGKQELLKKLPSRLLGYSSWLPADWRVVVLIDEDRQNCHQLKKRIVDAAEAAGIADRVLARVVVEELEAWFFGDIAALREAYPKLPATLDRRAGYRDPDAIPGGTWEALDRELKRAGYSAGLSKIATARAVATHMDPDSNSSKSFNVFVEGVRRMAGIAAA